MFERYSEKARRAIFFARYEASEYGSPYIETEHILLGLLREDSALVNRLAKDGISKSRIREQIDKQTVRRERISTSVEIPLTDECKRVLRLAAESADRLKHRSVEPEHLLLGILRVENCLAAQLLVKSGLQPAAAERVVNESRSIYTASAVISGQLALESFLGGLKVLKSDELIDNFAENAEFIDVSGQRWNREEIWRQFETLFAHYAKKNASYVIESTLAETRELLVATVLWKNAMLASEERIWLHRMTAILIAERGDWSILLLQVTPVQPASATAKQSGN